MFILFKLFETDKYLLLEGSCLFSSLDLFV